MKENRIDYRPAIYWNLSIGDASMCRVDPQDDPAKIRYDRVARFYDALNFLIDWFVSRQRREILRQVRGNVLEVGVGTGASFKDYPPCGRIVAVDISPEMLRWAGIKRRNYNGMIDLRAEDVQGLSFEEETFDTVFSSLVFCSVTNPVKGLSEVRRVLKSGGRLLMLEHVRSKNKVIGSLMDKLNLLVARPGVDNINRQTVEYLREAGFKIEQERNLAFDVVKAIVASKPLSEHEAATYTSPRRKAVDLARADAFSRWLSPTKT